MGISGTMIANAKTGQGYPKHAIIYAAVVDRKITWEQYASGGFNDRMDCIYTYSAADGRFSRNVDALVHNPSDEEKAAAHTKRDTHKNSVLLCRDFRYFGENAIPLSTLSPELEYLGGMGRGERVFDSAVLDHEEKFELFENLIGDLWRKPTSYTISVADARACLRGSRSGRWLDGGWNYWMRRAGGRRKGCRTKPRRPNVVDTAAPIERTGRVRKGRC